MRQLELQLLEIWILLTHYKTLLLQPISSLSSPGTQQVLFCFHQVFHANSQALPHYQNLLQLTSEDLSVRKTITASCKICQTSSHILGIGVPFSQSTGKGFLPGSDWQLDCTHMPTVRHLRYLLVPVDTLSGWAEALPSMIKDHRQFLVSFSGNYSPFWSPHIPSFM